MPWWEALPTPFLPLTESERTYNLSTQTPDKAAKLVKKVKCLLKQLGCPRWLHRFGPKKYTAWMHLKCVFLKEKLKDYSWRDLVSNVLPYFFPGRKIPHFTTLQKFARRMPIALWNQILRWSAQANYCAVDAIDGTGFSRTKANSYYTKRIDRDTPLKRHLQVIIYTDCRRRKVISAKVNAKSTYEGKAVPT